MRNRCVQSYYHSIFHITVLCANIAIGGGSGTQTPLRSSNRRSRHLHANNSIVDRISNSDLLTTSQALLVIRETNDQSDSTKCNSLSTNWIRQQVRNISDEDLNNFFEWKVYTLPFVYKLLVEEKGIREYIGADGKYSRD